MHKYQSIRGMPDILPAQTPAWHFFENAWRALMHSYVYQEIRLPILESTGLFKRSIGDATEVVSKEMYTFADRDGHEISLRPEGTAGCVRAGIEHGLLYNQTQKFWYQGPMFRYERPQKGRYRQFYQVGIEAFGFQGPGIECEQILLAYRLWKALKIDSLVRLEINSLGNKASRAKYTEVLVDYFQGYASEFTQEEKTRLAQNPLRLLDSKAPHMQTITKNAPRMLDYLDDASKAHYAGFKGLLETLGVPFVENPKIVRGLDYYQETVYEWVTDDLGAQNAVCAGGRYDGLVEQLGGKPTSGVGFAMGIERLLLLLEKTNQQFTQTPEVYTMALEQAYLGQAFEVAEKLREHLPSVSVYTETVCGSLKNQLKKAHKSGAAFAVLLGKDEIENHQVTLKWLRKEKPQEALTIEALIQVLNNKGA